MTTYQPPEDDPDAIEPDELPPKPEPEGVDDDGAEPGDEPIPEQDVMAPDQAEADDTVDDAENDKP